ncbi:hypothetical protein FNV43_RR27239 [Rhamnella rubrinervis]|uniref:Uncharacterized protein n=1 Tax=Rhamnella rubrinervis TaxID=2594499 RepID=A0A8K0DQW9_9ROSA|nr:hypothetical protein FNV43_RR27239 [Rhamnella rubrinervis]
MFKDQTGKIKHAYNLYEFPLVFQIWGIEVILIVPTITPHGKYHGVKYPRMPSCSGEAYPSVAQELELVHIAGGTMQFLSNKYIRNI